MKALFRDMLSYFLRALGFFPTDMEKDRLTVSVTTRFINVDEPAPRPRQTA